MLGGGKQIVFVFLQKNFDFDGFEKYFNVQEDFD